jgi:hypothetical protein
MSLPSSGPLSISAIKTELGLPSVNSLAGLSNAGNRGGPPYPMSAFYGYSSLPSGLVAAHDRGNYSGSTWYDSTGNGNHITLTNPVYSYNTGFTASSSSDFTMALNSTVGTSTFTWCMMVRFFSDTNNWEGLWWSEGGYGKNIACMVWTPGNPGAFYPRVDSSGVSKAVWNYSAGYSNVGTSPINSTGDMTSQCSYAMLTFAFSIDGTGKYYVTTDSGTTKVYNTSDFGFNSWPWQDYRQPLHFMCYGQGNYYANANFLANYMFNRELTTTELNSLYAAKKINIC